MNKIIDYEKLKMAHELGDKLNFESWDIQLNYGTYNNIVLHFEDHQLLSHEYEYQSLSELIDDLKKLTSPKLKYEIGQEVWFMEDYEPVKLYVKDYWFCDSDNEYRYICNKDGYDVGEKYLYPSRESLIDAQIKYWLGIKYDRIIPIEEIRHDFEGEIKGFNDLKRHPDEVDIDRCQHEHDGMIYSSLPPQNKCKKCGEFYR